MTLSTFSDFAASDLRTFDLLIVGSGPAGISVAHALRDTGLRVALLESGGLEPTAETEALNETVNVGHRRADPEVTRRRCVGGSSTIWTGRCGMFDAIDHHARPWLPGSGWPIDADELAPWVFEAGRLLGLAPSRQGRYALRDLRQDFDSPPWDEALLQPVVWQFSRRDDDAEIHEFTAEVDDPDDELAILRHSGRMTPVDFGRAHIDWLRPSRTIHLITQATVLKIETEGRSVVGVRVVGPDGERLSLRGRATVLACGGIDNARMLLQSRSGSAPNGVGNNHDQVGRYLADHAFTDLGVYEAEQGKMARRRFGTRLVEDRGVSQTYTFGVRLSPEIQRSEGLLNASAHLAEFGTRPSPLASVASGVRTLRDGGPPELAVREMLDGLSRPVLLAESAVDRIARKRAALTRPDRVVMGCVVEQPIQPDSRLRLSDRTDRYGTPLPQIDWRVSEHEYQTVERFRQILMSEFERLGIDAPQPPKWVEGGFEAWRAQIVDAAHPMCSTRMSEDPKAGVVDAECKVHGVEGLYVAGSSVFPSPSHMNPTMMLVALALRLADHLCARLGPASAPASPALRSGRRRRPSRLAIIGAGDRVRQIYRPALDALEDDIEVVGITSRGGESARRLGEVTGWAFAENAERMVRESSPDFVLVAIPPNEIEGLYPAFLELNHPLLLETPFCWGVRSGRRLAKAIRDRRLTIGVAEQFPFLPVAQLERKLIELGAIGRPRAVENRFAIFDYHGIARLRAAIGRPELPAVVNAVRTSFPSHATAMSDGTETWERGIFVYETGETIEHRYSNEYYDSPVRDSGSLTIFGSHGSFDGSTLLYRGSDGQPVSSSVERHVVDGRLQSLSLETPLGAVAWRNPFAGSSLNEEQIAVATLLSRMAQSVRDGGMPAYDAVDALWDLELLAAMRASVERGGARVRLPVEPFTEKLRSAVRNKLRFD